LIEQERAVFDAGSRTQILLITPREIPLYAEFYGTSTDRFHLLPPPLVRQDTTPEFREATRQKVRREQGWREEESVMLLVGSDYRRKGLDRILLALASLPVEARTRTRLAVIGQDNPDPFKRQARRLGVLDRVQFLGARMDAHEFMMAADLLVHTAYTENTGTVLLEALTFGLPVLTHDTCGFAHHIAKAGAGLVLPSPFEQSACNRALRDMLTSSQSGQWRTHGLNDAATEDLYSCHERAAEIIERTVETKVHGKPPP
jgi:UDP-glucose:(heptosyl)LPS alpha-1,3-glucosyltransferase